MIAQIEFRWKNFIITNLIITFIFMNWLPKTPKGMYEREKFELIKIGDNLNSISTLGSKKSLLKITI
jgi:hypothetical protein